MAAGEGCPGAVLLSVSSLLPLSLMTAIRRLALLPLLALPLLLTACDSGDTGGEDVFTLPGAREVEFRFRPAQFNPGQDVAVPSIAAFQSASILTNGTFTYEPAQVASARIDGDVLLLLDQPISAMLSTYQLSEITLQLQTAGGAVVNVASRSDFSGLGSERRVTLPVSNADVTRFLQQNTFTASLIFDFANAPTAATEFSVEFDVRVEVEA